jgi:signal transduction histidine kinase
MAEGDDRAAYLRAGILSAQSTPLFSRDGKLVGMISTHWRRPHEPSERDVRLLDILARQAADLIERKQGEEALRRSQEVLRDADRRKDEFLAMLAHELRNPLAPIRNSLDVMKRSFGDAAVLEQCQSTMERQMRQMVRLVDDLLDVSRITRDKLELRKEQVDLASVIQSAVETSRPLINSMGHELTVSLPEEMVRLDADPVRFAQVVLNLLNNAAKYSERGGKIWLTAQHNEGEVVIRVRDTGVGIAQDMLPRVFEMFTQADKSLNRSQGGLGIGLSLVRRLVELHGGSIEAHSEGAGKGSEFVVRLPGSTSPVAPYSPKRTEGAHRSNGKLRVLVADDNRDAAEMLAMLLRMTGHEVHTVHDGDQAVAAANALQPKVILLDIGMPKLDGYSACRQIRSEPWGKTPIMVALTGWGQEEDRRHSAEAGFDHHLVKPVELDDLQALLATFA